MQDDQALNSGERNILPVITFQSDDLLEKLKLLNYENQLLRDLKMKMLSRFYFVKSTNPGEQFYMFTLICWWLLSKKLGKEMDRPQEFDDPNEVIKKIMKIFEEMDVPIDFPANKLIRGAGPSCLMVLDLLATQAIKVAKVSCQRPQITQEEEDAPEYVDDNAEIILEKLEDEQQTAASDDSDMELDGNLFKNLNWVSNSHHHENGNDEDEHKNVVEGLTNSWRLEFERALPKLKVFVKADARDWRSHLSQMETLKSNIEEIADETQMQLKKLHSEFTFSLEKVESREKHLNNELQNLIKQFKEVSIELSTVQYAQTQCSQETERVMASLNDVIAENDTKKAEMERRGQSMSDGSSVVQIKKAITKLRADVAQLNLEVALLLHGIDQDIIRQAGGGGANGDGDAALNNNNIHNHNVLAAKAF